VNSINYLTEGHLFRGLIAISLPIIASNLLQSVLEMVDLYFVGRLGANAIAGVAMSTTIIFVLATFIVGLVTATTAFISRHYGAQEHDAVGLIVQHALYIGLAFSLAISLFGLFFSKDLLKLLGANETVATLGSAYLSVLFLGIFTMVELWVVISSFQACGNSTLQPHHIPENLGL
jgi:Na+-driven multidrug efflux pump